MSRFILGDVTNGIRLVSEATGYGMVTGLSVAFAGIIILSVKVQKRYLQENSNTSEMFMVANRSVGRGLTASAVFSSWMWINETVFSCVMCYNYGISAPFWFAATCSFQIALMAVVGIVAKLRVPYAHTSLEIIRMRYGPIGHAIFTLLNLINNVFSCSNMILSGSQLIHGISGMHIAAATILLPVGVVLYTAVGGLKATFITDFIHTTIALTMIIWFTLSVLCNDTIGGLSGLYDKVLAAEAAGKWYIDGNYNGSMLTFKSKGGIMFGVIHGFGNLALVFMDTAFWQKSFASEVSATVPGYNIAAIAIFAVPWALGSVFGLIARVIQSSPIFPTYPDSFTAAQVGAGYVEPYVLYALIGKGGAAGLLLCLFMAVTSTVSSSMIAVSSILSFDVYRTYFNPKATDRQVVRISHLAVVFHGVFIAGIALTLNYGGANMSWVNYCSPILTSPAVFPLFFTILWSRQTRTAAIISPILGLATGIAVWLSSAKSIYGSISLTTTGYLAPALYGAIGSLFSPIVYSLIISHIKPSTFDWREFLRVEKSLVEYASPSDSDINTAAESPHRSVPQLDEKTGNEVTTPSTVVEQNSLDNVEHPFDAATLVYLRRWLKIAWIFFAVVTLVELVVWPLPLYRDYVFGKAFYSGWIVVGIIWQFFAFFAVVVYPIWDGWNAISKVLKGGWETLRERRKVGKS